MQWQAIGQAQSLRRTFSHTGDSAVRLFNGDVALIKTVLQRWACRTGTGCFGPTVGSMKSIGKLYVSSIDWFFEIVNNQL
jgi:hypothetical protein